MIIGTIAMFTQISHPILTNPIPNFHLDPVALNAALTLNEHETFNHLWMSLWISLTVTTIGVTNPSSIVYYYNNYQSCAMLITSELAIERLPDSEYIPPPLAVNALLERSSEFQLCPSSFRTSMVLLYT